MVPSRRSSLEGLGRRSLSDARRGSLWATLGRPGMPGQDGLGRPSLSGCAALQPKSKHSCPIASNFGDPLWPRQCPCSQSTCYLTSCQMVQQGRFKGGQLDRGHPFLLVSACVLLQRAPGIAPGRAQPAAHVHTRPAAAAARLRRRGLAAAVAGGGTLWHSTRCTLQDC
jgi:hypothetical protein